MLDPVFRQYERNTFYDRNGRIVYLDGDSMYGFRTPEWKEMKEGPVTRTIQDDTLPGGPREKVMVQRLCAAWGAGAAAAADPGPHPHEAQYLKLDCSKARTLLGWRPRWDLDTAIGKVVSWTRVYAAGGDVRAACLAQIEEYTAPELP